MGHKNHIGLQSLNLKAFKLIFVKKKTKSFLRTDSCFHCGGWRKLLAVGTCRHARVQSCSCMHAPSTP